MSRDRGSASIWLLCGCALVLVIGYAVTLRSTAVLARHRAESAADLTALAAAGQIGRTPAPCAAAPAIASANGARLRACRAVLAVDGRSGTVIVVVGSDIRLPVVGTRLMSATARAARMPAAASSAGRGRRGSL